MPKEPRHLVYEALASGGLPGLATTSRTTGTHLYQSNCSHGFQWQRGLGIPFLGHFQPHSLFSPRHLKSRSQRRLQGPPSAAGLHLGVVKLLQFLIHNLVLWGERPLKPPLSKEVPTSISSEMQRFVPEMMMECRPSTMIGRRGIAPHACPGLCLGGCQRSW